ncbi:MAG TPA: hypothetical protein VFH97_05300 [Gemmatimonadales bacterium]|nr:hypothetical protein [Gemmatimonadales bacterium]
MKPCDRVTILRNRVRARDLRLFRYRVREYFTLVEADADDQLVDWDGVRYARAEINRRLPRVVQVVEAADLDAGMLQDIFDERAGAIEHQRVLDRLDQAVGAYDATVFGALARTVNPFHYLGALLGLIIGLPRRALVAIGILTPLPRRRPDDAPRTDAALSRLIETKFAELRESQARLFAQHGDQMEELAERMDFLERVLSQQRPAPRLGKGADERASG